MTTTGMVLPHDEAEQFLALYKPLLRYAAQRAGEGKLVAQKRWTNQEWHRARELLWQQQEILTTFVNENPRRLSPEDLARVTAWRRCVRGPFVFFRQLRRYAILFACDGRQRGYGVLGITEAPAALIPGGTRSIVGAVLLPWRDRIVWDGLCAPSSVMLGPNMWRGLNERYRALRRTQQVVTSL